MALQSITALSKITLQEPSATVEFSGIPNTYRDLVLVMSARSLASGAGDNVGIYFNSDGSGYSTVRMYGTGSGTGSNFAPTSTRIAQIPVPAAGVSGFGVVTAEIMDYSETDKYTTVLIRGNNAADQVHAAAGAWEKVTAVNSITVDLYFTSNSFEAGSTFALFGRIA